MSRLITKILKSREMESAEAQSPNVERESDAKDCDLKNHPMVKKALATFPGSYVYGVFGPDEKDPDDASDVIHSRHYEKERTK